MKLLLLISLLTFSCAKKNTQDPVPISLLSVSGFSDFKNIIIGIPVKTRIVMINQNASPQNYTLTGPSDFTIASDVTNCALQVPAQTTCYYTLSVKGTARGPIAATVGFNGLTQNFKANVVAAGFLISSVTNINFGALVAGNAYNFSTQLSNSGDLNTLFPLISGGSGLSVLSNNCGSFIAPLQTCTVNMSFLSTLKSASIGSLINFYSGDNTATLNLTGSILAGSMTGNFGFTTSPTTVHADGALYSVVTTVMADVYGNAIEDGTRATLSFFNLKDTSGGTSPVTVLSSGGRYTFQFRSTTTTGTAQLSINTPQSSGSLSWSVIP